MRSFKFLTFPMLVTSIAAAGLLAGCASAPKKTPPPPPPPKVEKPAEAAPAEKPKPALKAVKAETKTAEHVGAGGPRRPKFKFNAMAPTGWTLAVKEKVEGNDVHVTVWANPPEGATEAGENAEQTIEHALATLGEGQTWKVHIYDHRKMEILRQEFTY